MVSLASKRSLYLILRCCHTRKLIIRTKSKAKTICRQIFWRKNSSSRPKGTWTWNSRIAFSLASLPMNILNPKTASILYCSAIIKESTMRVSIFVPSDILHLLCICIFTYHCIIHILCHNRCLSRSNHLLLDCIESGSVLESCSCVTLMVPLHRGVDIITSSWVRLCNNTEIVEVHPCSKGHLRCRHQAFSVLMQWYIPLCLLRLTAHSRIIETNSIIHHQWLLILL